jgi:hypothetical protein
MIPVPTAKTQNVFLFDFNPIFPPLQNRCRPEAEPPMSSFSSFGLSGGDDDGDGSEQEAEVVIPTPETQFGDSDEVPFQSAEESTAVPVSVGAMDLEVRSQEAHLRARQPTPAMYFC